MDNIVKYLATMGAVIALSGCGALALPNGKSWPTGSIVEHDSGLLSKDKGLHLLLGVGTATATRVIATEYTDWNRKEVMMAGCASAATVGVSKELYDKYVMETRFEVLDAVYTAAGCLLTFEWVF